MWNLGLESLKFLKLNKLRYNQSLSIDALEIHLASISEVSHWVHLCVAIFNSRVPAGRTVLRKLIDLESWIGYLVLNLESLHLDLSRSDLWWVRLSYFEGSFLVWSSRGLPRPFCLKGSVLLSIKLLSDSGLINIGTYLKGFLLLLRIGVFKNRFVNQSFRALQFLF